MIDVDKSDTASLTTALVDSAVAMLQSMGIPETKATIEVSHAGNMRKIQVSLHAKQIEYDKQKKLIELLEDHKFKKTLNDWGTSISAYWERREVCRDEEMIQQVYLHDYCRRNCSDRD